MTEWQDWLSEAHVDLTAALNLGQAKLYAPACFHCQQAAEKALKALLVQRTNSVVKTHSLRELADKAGVLSSVKDFVSDLDADYSASRYFNAPGKPPAEIYDAATFEQRIKTARRIVSLVEEWTKN